MRERSREREREVKREVKRERERGQEREVKREVKREREREVGRGREVERPHRSTANTFDKCREVANLELVDEASLVFAQLGHNLNNWSECGRLVLCRKEGC